MNAALVAATELFTSNAQLRLRLTALQLLAQRAKTGSDLERQLAASCLVDLAARDFTPHEHDDGNDASCAACVREAKPAELLPPKRRLECRICGEPSFVVGPLMNRVCEDCEQEAERAR